MREKRRLGDRAFELVTAVGAILAILPFLVLLLGVFTQGVGSISWHFFTNFASRFPERAGIRAPLLGTVWLMALTSLISFPVSVGAAIYLEEYAPRNWMSAAIRTNIATLAGVPSIVYGILGMALFGRTMHLGRSVLAGALTLSILVMPLIILAAQEAIRRVPTGVREAAYGLGATRWQVVRYHVLPMAFPGVLSGSILALARAVGEAAPLMMIGAVTFIAFTPEAVSDPFTALPVQIFHWVTRPQEEFQGLAAAAILVLLGLLLSMSGLAVILRNRLEKRI